MPEKIVKVNVQEQYLKDYKLYALYVCRHRVAVDGRDGLKPIARKILYSTFEKKSRTKYPNIIKSAKIAGDVIANYSPHGENAAYGAMKPMTNDFEIKVPLLHGGGNWGSKFGDPPAAMRYTESGLSKFSQEYLLGDLYQAPNCVDWMKNFDESTIEPECLPAAVPIVLIEGTFGIAVGFKVEIPKHNVTEVLDATINLIKDPSYQVVLVPDHCQECEIIDTDFESISNIGFGSYRVRGIIESIEHNGHPALLCKSAPDLIYFDTIKATIEKLILSKKLINIVDILNNDDKLLILLKPGTDTNYVKQLIYQNTKMEMSCRVNFEVLDNMVPMRMSYKSYLLQWIEFRKFTKFRVYCNSLQDINTRIHTIEPYVKMAETNDIDSVISLIRNKAMPDNELMEYLIKKLDITDIQAKFIMNIKLKELSVSYFRGYLAEYNELCTKRTALTDLLTDDSKMQEEIITELETAKQKYGKPRVCKIISKAQADGIPSGEFKIIFTEGNMIKKIPMNEGIPNFKNDSAKFILKGENSENLIIFTETGKVFKLAINKIPFSDKRSNGIDVRLLLKNCTSNISAVIYEPLIKTFSKKLRKHYLVTLTRSGYIKKMDLDDFLSVNQSGLIYSKLDSDDYIKDIMISTDQADVVVYSNNMATRFSMQEVPYLKRSTKGNKTMSTSIDGISLIMPDTTDIVVVTRKGYINRFSPVGLASTDRMGRPTKVIKLTKDDVILGVFGLRVQDTLVISASSGKMNIDVNSIPVGSSAGGGTKMIPNKGDTIVSCSFIHND